MEKHIIREIADNYQPLFDYMYSHYELILTISEMDDIIHLCDKVKENFANSIEVKDHEEVRPN